MIIKLLIIGIVTIAGIVLIYPDELIQFSKGSTLQETTEQSFSNLKDSSISEIKNSIAEDFQQIGNKIKNSITSIFD